MDLSKFDTKTQSANGAVMVVRNPHTGAPFVDEDSGEDVTVTLMGTDSPIYRRVQQKQQTERVRQSSARGRLHVTGEQLDSDALDLLVSCTVGWKHIGLGGSELDCTPANARKVYEDYPWLREQAEAFIAERSNFLGN